jgi:DNA-binding HxlR family transcriptional regulator
MPAADLEPIDEPPLEVAASAVPDPVRTLLSAVHDDRALGLLLELDARGPLSVRQLLDETELCESDLHGLLAELRVAGLLAETRVAGERGYRLTETGSDALAALTGD